MSEQPTNVTNLDQYRPAKSDGSLEMDAQTDVAFQKNITVPKYDEATVRLGRQMFENSQKVEIEHPRLSEVAVRGLKLATLNEVRDRYKDLAETKFLRDEAA